MINRYLAITTTVMYVAFAAAQPSEARVVKFVVEQRSPFVGGAERGNVGPYEMLSRLSEFAADSPLEEGGFEPSVPRQGTAFFTEGNELYPLPINHQVGRSCIRRKAAEPGTKKPVPAAAVAALSRRRGSKSARADEA